MQFLEVSIDRERDGRKSGDVYYSQLFFDLYTVQLHRYRTWYVSTVPPVRTLMMNDDDDGGLLLNNRPKQARPTVIYSKNC
jgi:hypothetical protein